MSKPLQLNVRVTDCILEDEMVDSLPKSRIGCFVQYDGNFQDALMIKKGGQNVKSDNLNVVLKDSP